MTLTLRWNKFCDSDIWKQAIRKRKKMGMKNLKDKNMSTNVLGETRAKVYVQQQDISTLVLRKFSKRNKETEKEEKE